MQYSLCIVECSTSIDCWLLLVVCLIGAMMYDLRWKDVAVCSGNQQSTENTHQPMSLLFMFACLLQGNYSAAQDLQPSRPVGSRMYVLCVVTVFISFSFYYAQCTATPGKAGKKRPSMADYGSVERSGKLKVVREVTISCQCCLLLLMMLMVLIVANIIVIRCHLFIRSFVRV